MDPIDASRPWSARGGVNPPSRLRRLLVVLLVAAMFAGACSTDPPGDDDESSGWSEEGNGAEDDVFEQEVTEDDVTEQEVTLPAKVGQIVRQVNQACGQMADEAVVLERDYAEGLVDSQPEWDEMVEVRADYAATVTAIDAWQGGVIAAIQAGAGTGEIEAALADLPTDGVGVEDETASTMEVLHEQLVSGRLEPQGVDREDVAFSTAALRVGLSLLIRYGPAILEISGTVIEMIEDWRDRRAAEEEALRDRLVEALGGISCTVEWPSGITRPAVLWDVGTCAPAGVVANLHARINGEPLFEFTAPAGATVVGVSARHGSLVDAIGIVTAAGGERVEWGLQGGAGGGHDGFDLAGGEDIAAIEVVADAFVNSVVFETDTGRRYRFGHPGRTNASQNPTVKRYEVPDGARFAGLQGQSAVFRPTDGSVAVKALGCVYRPA
ncbi:MAG: hypothetical protein ACR2QK_10370 [Acidimicrobiales bacterium]